MKDLFQKVGSLCAIALAAALTVVPLHAQLNAVYVQTNDPTANTVVGYSIDSVGNLTPLPGSPYSTGGTGWPGPTALQQDDDGQVLVNSASTLLYTVNGHSDTVAGYHINSDGSLTPVSLPIRSAGAQPASLALFENVLQGGGSLLSVLNKASDTTQAQQAPSLVTFAVGSTGTLTPELRSKLTFPVGDSPSQVVSAPGRLAFVDEFMGSPSKVDSYRIRSNGSYSLINSVSVKTGQNVFLGMVRNPTSNYLYAALPVDSLISVLSYSSSTGVLTHVVDVPEPGQLACWLEINTAGTRLYAAETMSKTIAIYDTTNPALPVLLQQVALSKVNDSFPAPWNVKLDPTGNFLYVVSNRTLHVLNVAADGTLTETVSPTIVTTNTSAHPYGLGVAQR